MVGGHENGMQAAKERALLKVMLDGSVEERRETAAEEELESSGCIRMRDIPILDQSVLREVR